MLRLLGVGGNVRLEDAMTIYIRISYTVMLGFFVPVQDACARAWNMAMVATDHTAVLACACYMQHVHCMCLHIFHV